MCPLVSGKGYGYSRATPGIGVRDHSYWEKNRLFFEMLVSRQKCDCNKLGLIVEVSMA